MLYIIADRGQYYSDSKVHGANMGPIWGWQDPGGPHVGPMNFAIWVVQLMAFLLLGAKSLPENKFQWNQNQNTIICIWKYHLQNGGRFDYNLKQSQLL